MRARSRQAWVAIVASVAIASLTTACDLNPQPLPPGDEPDGSVNETPPGNNNNGGTGFSSNDGGTAAAPPEALVDGGARDGSLDGAVDGEADGSSDASIDAGDAAD